jgi:hypothetical protein
MAWDPYKDGHTEIIYAEHYLYRFWELHPELRDDKYLESIRKCLVVCNDDIKEIYGHFGYWSSLD